MLWKYKKCYQENEEEIIVQNNPKVPKCMNLLSITNNSGMGMIDANYYLCNSNVMSTIQIPDGQTITINKCVKKAPDLTITWTNNETSHVIPFGGAEANSSINVIQSGTGQTCSIQVGTICAYE